jgi:protein phosphatase
MQAAPRLPAVEFAARSDPGRDPDKQVNEDAFGQRETRFGHLCVVCDGMGGHAAGREAAELAVSAIFEVFDATQEGATPASVLRSAVEEASRRVHTMRTSEVAMGRPGSTAVAVLMHAGGTEVAHVGDSRAYLVHEGQIARLTRDHSIVQEMVDRGLITAQQAAHHPDANRITRALGMADAVEVDVRAQPVGHVAGDAFVLCSDGLSDLVEDREILEIVGSEPAGQAVGKLVDLANARGGHDNVTVLVLRARETALSAAGTVAPTVAQTSVTQPPADAPTATVPLEARAEPPPQPALIPTTAPPSSVRSLPRRTASLPVVVGVLLAAVAVALLGSVLFSHFAERGGKRSAPATLDLPEAGVAPALPVSVGPERIATPPPEQAPARPVEPIAPLEPPTTPTARVKRPAPR